jgi:hypothetical protein
MSVANRHVRLCERAIRGGWVDDERAERVLAEMERVILSPTATLRDKVNAAKVVMLAAGIDAQREGNTVNDRTEDNRGRLAAMQAYLAAHPEAHDVILELLQAERQPLPATSLPDSPLIARLDPPDSPLNGKAH